MKKVCLITGGSSGIGLAAAKAMASRGMTVYELSRRDSVQEGITHISGDVTKEESVAFAVREVALHEGRLDVLVCCAGFGISGAVEFTELSDAKRQLDVNFFGVVNTVKPAISVMRKQGFGKILLISSVAGQIPIPFQTYYSVSKAAVNAYGAALLNELRPFGIQVCSIMPGDIKTGFTAARNKTQLGDDIYSGRISRSVSKMEKDEENGMSAQAAGLFICRMAEKKKLPPSCSIGFTYKLFTAMSRLFPQSLISRVVYSMYGK